MVFTMGESEASVIRSKVLNLINKKAGIEEEIKAMGVILTQNGVGMNEPLVDLEGFPLANVDVYQVRIARNKIICLQNDYKALLKEIENGLSEYYGSNIGSSDATVQQFVAEDNNREHLKPFAKVSDVREGSPADEAGLKNEDLIIEFGSVNGSNFKDLSTIANIVKHSENSEILLRIERSSRSFNMKLRPHKWTGRGLLGCVIAPLESIDR